MGLKQIYWKLRSFIYWRYIAPFKWRNYTNDSSNQTSHFTIGIVTYIARYDSYFKKLIHQLSVLFPNAEIIVMVNGYYDEKAQTEYLKKVQNQLQSLLNVSYFVEEKPTGLSKLWNTLLIKAKHPLVFIFNDDISISPSLKEELQAMRTDTICLLNNSWSHFLYNKATLRQVGWFDERFTGIGNEDQDYEFRLANAGVKLDIIYCNKIKNEVDLPSDYSYGKDMLTVNKKYSASNETHFKNKWTTYPTEQKNTIYSKKFDMWFDPVPKLPTPDFYPELHLTNTP